MGLFAENFNGNYFCKLLPSILFYISNWKNFFLSYIIIIHFLMTQLCPKCLKHSFDKISNQDLTTRDINSFEILLDVHA